MVFTTYSSHVIAFGSYIRGHFEGNAWECRSHCRKATGTLGKGVPIVKLFVDGIANYFPTKIHQIQDFAYAISKFPEMIHPDLRRRRDRPLSH